MSQRRGSSIFAQLAIFVLVLIALNVVFRLLGLNVQINIIGSIVLTIIVGGIFALMSRR